LVLPINGEAMPSFEFQMGPTLQERIQEALTKARDDAQEVLARTQGGLSDLEKTRIVIEGRLNGIEAALLKIASDVNDLTTRAQD
jgi:hypothetical protein